MRTLSEIIEDTKDGGRPKYEELRYALIAMEALSNLDESSLRFLAESPERRKIALEMFDKALKGELKTPED